MGTGRLKQVIVVRRDLKMRRGKEIAQGSHASSLFLLNAYLEGRTSELDLEKIRRWVAVDGMRKAAVRVDSEAEILEIHAKAQSAGLTCHLILDEGVTEFNGEHHYTALAIGPDEEDQIDQITGHLTLY